MKAIPQLTDVQIAHFWERIDRLGPDDCWVWTKGKQPDGYGQLGFGSGKGNVFLAHRVAYFLATGLQPGKLKVLHQCDNPPCCNPHHLLLGTQQQNINDMAIRGRARKAKGSANGNAKLTAADVRAIRRSTETHVKLAERYGVTDVTIGDIRRCKTWNHL